MHCIMNTIIYFRCIHGGHAIAPFLHTSVSGAHKLLSPQNCNEGHFYLQQCKPHSNTVTRTPTKWDVSQRVTLCLLFWAEPERRKQLELVNFSSHVILSFKEKKRNQPEQSYFVRKKLLRRDSNPRHTAC